MWNIVTTYIQLADDPKSPEVDPKKLEKIDGTLFQDRNYLIHEVRDILYQSDCAEIYVNGMKDLS